MTPALPYRFALVLGTLLLFASAGFTQTGIYIPKNGNVFFKSDTATIFTNVINDGKLGIGKKAVVNFIGKTWSNNATSLLTDENNNTTGTDGGLIRLISTTTKQQIDGGYNTATKSGPQFHSLQIQNPFGVELLNSSAKIGGEVDFQKGLFYLNNQLLTIGNGSPGNIKGYDSSRYFITNRNGGMLLREGINSTHGWITFPVGTKEGSYTPAALRSLSELPDDFYVAVFDSVFSGATNGNAMMKESVGKTWQIGKRFLPGQGEVELALQHLNNEEGTLFTAGKTTAYISQFVNGSWDVSYPQTYPGIGYLTTGALLANSGANSRLLTSVAANTFFTKFTGAGDTTHTRLWFNAYRLNIANVKVYWSTKPEINVKHFIVQRRLANETDFANIDTVSSLALNGYSNTLLNYTINDPNGYKGISFYRLLTLAYNNDSAYSQVVAVGNKAGEFESELWPNPTAGQFYLSLNTPQPTSKIVVWNVLGQKVLEQATNNQRFIQVNAIKLAQGNYYVSIFGINGTILETKKLIIAR
ncbi:MAG TPA: T9SS type A sorting domain-containing protein [Flavisolibacter sp.]|nr:T9SS type A sorting domain-containing protein [Flavisolibacter sp.]